MIFLFVNFLELSVVNYSFTNKKYSVGCSLYGHKYPVHIVKYLERETQESDIYVFKLNNSFKIM